MELRSRHEIPVEAVARSWEDDVDRAFERLAVSDWLWTALTQLPEDIRATIMLRHFSRRASYAEISAVLGVPLGTVRSRLSQGRRYLAQALDATATGEHLDYSLLVRRRWQECTEALRIMQNEGRAVPYFADCSTDVLVSAPAIGYETRGTDQEQRNIESGLAVGVRMRLVRVLPVMESRSWRRSTTTRDTHQSTARPGTPRSDGTSPVGRQGSSSTFGPSSRGRREPPDSASS
jgi:RNA polymerase sigma-70 factor (ECF subfamily)